MKRLLFSIALTFLVAAAVMAQYPVTDSLTGSGVMTTPWSQSSIVGAITSTCSKSSTGIVATTSGDACLVVYTAGSITADHYSQLTFTSSYSGADNLVGPCVRCATTGTGYIWAAGGAVGNIVIELANGAYVTTVISSGSMPAVTDGDVLKLAVQGSTITATDVTTGLSATGTNSDLATGNPGISQDQTGSLNTTPTDFQADCYPASCGTIAPPVFSPSGGTYGPAQTVTITYPSGASACYTTDSTTPTATTPGTCTHGTLYAGPITISSTTTLKAISTQTGQVNSSVTTATYTIVGSQTWYIRLDGGNLTQCSGNVDAPYVPGMTTKDCGLSDPRFLAYNGDYVYTATWIIKGGDSIYIHKGQYRGGYSGPNSGDHDGLADAGSPNASAFPPLPSGTATNPTRIIGDGSKLTQLYGGYSAGTVLNLAGSAFVAISGIELTDHGQCTRVGLGYTAPVVACSSNYPLSDYAQTGIVTSTGTHDVTLSDVNIHGFTNSGILGPVGGLITLDHVRIAFNGAAGWNLDDGNGTQSINNASIVASYLTVEGNGCNEEYPIVHPDFPAASCFDQNSTGYGDGIGTPNTPINFSCDHCIFRYNTQDGPDLLHTANSIYKVTNSTSYGNMGQQWKMGAMKSMTFTNNVTIHNCNRMSKPIGGNTTFMKYLSLFCRAAGDGFALGITDGSTYTITNNSFAGYGNTTYDISCSGTCTKPAITFQNNLSIGYTRPGADGQTPGFEYDSLGFNPFVANDHNVTFQMRTCPDGSVCTDPQVANEPTDAQVQADETVLDNIDFHLTSASVNATGKGTGGADIGAMELGALPPSAVNVLFGGGIILGSGIIIH